jgi:hypothetical protein
MSERVPRQENAPAKTDDSIVSPGEQLSLIPEPPRTAPTRPTANTLAERLLCMLGTGERLTHPQFEVRTGSWRLAAVAFELSLLGWQIGVTGIRVLGS